MQKMPKKIHNNTFAVYTRSKVAENKPKALILKFQEVDGIKISKKAKAFKIAKTAIKRGGTFLDNLEPNTVVELWIPRDKLRQRGVL